MVREKAPDVASPGKQVAGFIAKFEPAVARVARTSRTVLRRRFPTAIELVYDNYNALAIGWGPTERASDAIVSLAVYASGVNLYFLRGAGLPDPMGLLEGSGRQGRFVRLADPAVLRKPAVVALLQAAEDAARTPLPSTGKGYIVIKSVSSR